MKDFRRSMTRDVSLKGTNPALPDQLICCSSVGQNVSGLTQIPLPRRAQVRILIFFALFNTGTFPFRLSILLQFYFLHSMLLQLLFLLSVLIRFSFLSMFIRFYVFLFLLIRFNKHANIHKSYCYEVAHQTGNRLIFQGRTFKLYCPNNNHATT